VNPEAVAVRILACQHELVPVPTPRLMKLIEAGYRRVFCVRCWVVIDLCDMLHEPTAPAAP